MVWICSCGDPTQLAGFLHPSPYGSPSYLGIWFRFLLLYSLPLILISIMCISLSHLFNVRPSLNLSLVLIAVFPPTVWVLFTYLDPSHKGGTNLLELAVLGALVGASIGINGRFACTWRCGIILSYCLGVVAFAFWMWIPGHPTNPWNYY